MMEMLKRISTMHDRKRPSTNNSMMVTVFSIKPEPQEAEPKIAFDPLHRMHSEYPFAPMKAQMVIKKILESNLDGVEYDPDIARDKAISISNQIKNKVKSIGFARYKYVCTVLIVEKLRQDLVLSRKVLQSQEDDGYAEYTYENETLLAHAVVIAFYFE
ncbi:tctex1 domain-containing protein 4-like [Argonauta hians]